MKTFFSVILSISLGISTGLSAQESKPSIIAVADATVTDSDGNTYKTVKIGNQIWMAENLRTTKFNDGQSIPHVTGDYAWGNLTTPGYCFGNFPEPDKKLFGAWYNWYAADSGKLAPKGWHIPTVTEWKTLAAYLGGENVAGGAMKSTGIRYWLPPNTGATDSSGFSAYPAGYRNYDGLDISLPKYRRSPIDHASFWTANQTNATEAFGTRLVADRQDFLIANYSVMKTYGYSVRCIKDTPKK